MQVDGPVVETAMVVHVEQIIGGAPLQCETVDTRGRCTHDAVMLVTSEPDMEPGFVCRAHGLTWVVASTCLLHELFPADDDAPEASPPAT